METQLQTDAPQDPSTTPLPTPILTLPGDITVRHYHVSDATTLSKHANNRAIWNNLRNRMPHPYTEAHSRDWIIFCNNPSNFTATGPCPPPDPASLASLPNTDGNFVIQGTGPKISTHFCICVSGVAMGSIGIEFGAPGDVYARSAEIGYWLGEEFWGRGVMKAVVPAFVTWAWRTFGVLVRLNAEVDEINVGSRKVLEGAGFKVEGRREKAIWKNGALKDIVYLGKLRLEGVEVEVEE